MKKADVVTVSTNFSSGVGFEGALAFRKRAHAPAEERKMLKFLVPIGILIAAVPFQSSEAARCPVGQMYRVTLKSCAPRAQNVHFISGVRHRQAALVSRPAKDVARPRRDAEATQSFRSYSSQPEPLNTPFNARSDEPAPANVSPYGALR